MWYPESQPIFDAFDTFRPEIFVGETYTLDRATINILKEYPETLVSLIASDNGTESDNYDPKEFHVLIAREDEIKLVEKLKEETGKPEFLQIHYSDKSILQTHNHWQKLGLRTISHMCCGDPFEFLGGEVKEEYKCDLSMCGGFWEYKGRNLNKYITPLCHPIGKYHIKIFGSNWPVVQFHGALGHGVEKDLFVSSKICLNTSEPHSTDRRLCGFDANERIFKVTMAGGFPLDGGYVKTIHEDIFTNGEIDYAETTKEYIEKVDYYLANPEIRQQKAKAAHETCVKSHTGFDRMRHWFGAFGLEKEAVAMRESKIKYLTGKGYKIEQV